jgi:hypothetical protein
MLYNDLPPYQPFSVAFLRPQVVLVLDPLRSIVTVLNDTAVPECRLVGMKHDHYCASVVCRRFVRRQCGPEISWELTTIVVETWQLDLITGVRVIEKGSAIIFLF